MKIAFACGHSNSCISVTAFEKAPGQLDPTLRSLRHERLGHYVCPDRGSAMRCTDQYADYPPPPEHENRPAMCVATGQQCAWHPRVDRVS